VLLLASALPVAARGEGAPPRPNILLVVAEDFGPRLGAYGDAVAVTPRLDALAREGVRYTHAFTVSGVCGPSRAALLTGTHPIGIGAQHMRPGDRGYQTVPPPEVKAFPELLRGAGYYTFTDTKLDYQFSGMFAGSGPFTIWDDEGLFTGWDERDPGEPFFGLVNILVTHESALFPRPAWPRNRWHLLMQLVYGWEFLGHESVADPEDVAVPPYYPDVPAIRRDIARQYDNANLMDEIAGKLLDRLRADGLAEETIVIFTSDHGDGLPRHKRSVYDSGIRVPLVIRWPDAWRPEGLEPGSADAQLVSFVDLAPTILAMAGEPAPPFMVGRVFAGGGEETSPPRTYVFAQKDRMDEADPPDWQRAVRDERWKYIRNYRPERAGAVRLTWRDTLDSMRALWAMHEAGELEGPQRLWFRAPRPNEALYDLESDPHEVRNLANDPAHAETLARLSSELDAWLARTGDLGAIPEAELAERMWPGGEQPGTAAPEIRFETEDDVVMLVLGGPTPGASLAYHVPSAQEEWVIYDEPVPVPAGARIEARAVRYGYAASEATEARAPEPTRGEAEERLPEE